MALMNREMKVNSNQLLKSFEKIIKRHSQSVGNSPDGMQARRVTSHLDFTYISSVISCFFRQIFLRDFFSFSQLSQMLSNLGSKPLLFVSPFLCFLHILWFHVFITRNPPILIHALVWVFCVIIPINYI